MLAWLASTLAPVRDHAVHFSTRDHISSIFRHTPFAQLGVASAVVRKPNAPKGKLSQAQCNCERPRGSCVHQHLILRLMPRCCAGLCHKQCVLSSDEAVFGGYENASKKHDVSYSTQVCLAHWLLTLACLLHLPLYCFGPSSQLNISYCSSAA